MDSLVDDNFSEIRKTFTDPLYNAMGLHVDMGASFHDCGTRDDYGIGCCATLDGVTHYAKAWPIEDHDSRWGACMGSFTFDESLAGNGVDYVSPDSLAKIMGDYGYHDSRSFLDCNLDVWSDELVGILGYEVFGSSQSEALVLSPLADKESVLQLFYTFSEKADGLISDELFNTLYWEMEAEERFAHARPIEAVDIDFDRARDIASSCLHRQIELKDDISFRLALDILPKLNWDGPSIAIDALNYLADTQEFGIEALRSHATELFGGVTLNDVPSFGFDDGWDGSCLNRLDWFEDAAGMDADGLSAGLVANDAESIKALIGNCPAWIECFPSYSEKAAKGVDDAVQAVKAYRLEGKRVHREVIPGYLYETAKAAAAKTAGGADGGTGPHI